MWGVSLCTQGFTQSNGLLRIKDKEAWGSLLIIGEPPRSENALSAGLHPNL